MRPEELEMALQEPDPFSLVPPPLRRYTNDTATSRPAPPLFKPDPFNNSPVSDATVLPSQARTAARTADPLHAGATSASASASASPSAILSEQPAEPTSSYRGRCDSWPQYTPPALPVALDPEVFDRLRKLQAFINRVMISANNKNNTRDNARGICTGTTTTITTTNNSINTTNDDNGNGNWTGNGQGYALRALTSVARSTAANTTGTAAVYPSTDPRHVNHSHIHLHRRGAIAPPPGFPLPPMAVPVAMAHAQAQAQAHPAPAGTATTSVNNGVRYRVIAPPPGFHGLAPVSVPVEPLVATAAAAAEQLQQDHQQPVSAFDFDSSDEEGQDTEPETDASNEEEHADTESEYSFCGV
jgi:hypothetical protein